MARQSFIHQWTVGLGAGATAICLLPGCTHTNWFCLDKCASIPKGAIPDPVGTKVNWAIEAQAANAAEDDFVIYKHEWIDNGTELGPYGKYHLAEMVKRLPTTPLCVVIQPSGRADLDESRRQGLVVVLGMKGIADAESRVIVAHPKAEGLYGDEAQRIYYDMLNPQNANNLGGYGGAGYGYGGYSGVGGFGGYGGFRGGYGGGYGGFRGGFGGGYGGYGAFRGGRY